jgi:hypothetical protein
MRRRLAGLLVTASLVAWPVAQAPAHDPVAVAAKTCRSGYTHARIGGAEKCLHAGEFCAKAHKKQYPRYGYRCVGGRLR